jgi:hypothetical protein
MTLNGITESQRRAAKAVGFVYLFVLVPAIFAEFYVLDKLVNLDSAAETARNIIAHERLFRLGVLSNLTVFCYLWLKSRYIPRALAALGLVGSVLLAACTYAFIIFPEARSVISVTYYGGPIFLFELTVGLWLLLRPLRAHGAAEPAAAAA